MSEDVCLKEADEIVVFLRAIHQVRKRVYRDLQRVRDFPDRQGIHGQQAGWRHAVEAVLFAIGERFLEADMNVAALLRELDIDRNHIHPHFHATLGTTPWKYICDQRFEVASRLLRDTHLPIWKVSRFVGYHDARTFTRAFRNATGLTPSVAARKLKRRRFAVQIFP